MQTNGKTRMTWRFFSRGSRACQHANPRCMDRSLGGSVANWHHTKPTRWAPQEPHGPSEGSSMTHSTRVALCGSRGVSTIPLTISSPKHRTIFSRASMGSQATKPSRRWQPPRVISTTGLQHDHQVPLDTTLRCNTLESHSLTYRIALLLGQVS